MTHQENPIQYGRILLKSWIYQLSKVVIRMIIRQEAKKTRDTVRWKTIKFVSSATCFVIYVQLNNLETLPTPTATIVTVMKSRDIWCVVI